MSDTRPVGFFDSGLGGISVLREARRRLPDENYVYYGDSANAPYGEKTAAEIQSLSDAVVQKLLAMDAKAIVVACNTATGEAVDYLREKYPSLPIIGVEPAIRPAVKKYPGGHILVMATPQCLRSRRVTELLARYQSDASIDPVPCGGLMEFVERGEFSGEYLQQYLHEKLVPFTAVPVDAVVIGCTHYPFIRAAIAEELGPRTELIDGNAGIAAQLQRRLSESGLLNDFDTPGTVSVYNSSSDPLQLERSYRLLLLHD